jgi:hypothetical protein
MSSDSSMQGSPSHGSTRPAIANASATAHALARAYPATIKLKMRILLLTSIHLYQLLGELWAAHINVARDHGPILNVASTGLLSLEAWTESANDLVSG